MMFYRFLPASFKSVDIMHSRDLDSPILERECEIIRIFEKSTKSVLIARDHPSHFCRALGGMISFKGGAMNNMSDLVCANIQKYINGWYSDQLFLQDFVYPKVRNNSLIYDSFDLFKDEVDDRITNKFPSERIGDEFIGMVLNEDGSRVEEHHKILRDEEKRRKETIHD
jgi:hypothetical protein